MISTPIKLYRLIVSLNQKTLKSEKIWHELSGNPDEYMSQIGSNKIYISRKLNSEASFNQSEPVFDFTMIILNSNGSVVEEFDDITLANGLNSNPTRPLLMDGTPYNAMQGLFEAARRNALGTESVIDALLDELRS